MEKLMYVMWGPGPEGSNSYRDELLDEILPRIRSAEGKRVSLDVDDSESVCPSPAPGPAGEDPHVAVISAWVDCYDRRAGIETAVASMGRPFAGYRVLESLYTDYGGNQWSAKRSWPPGDRSPGISTVALIHRPAGMADDDFRAAWHGVQSPRSGEIQPRSRYVRNQVVHAVTDGAPPVDGIVEECWPSIVDVTDPMRFFCANGDPELLTKNIDVMMESVTGCLDLARLRSSTMSEYLW